MRCYHINNFYLSGIHAGIQSAHAQHEMALKYLVKKKHNQDASAAESYIEWIENHKTIVVLNGGMSKDLLVWQEFLSRPANSNLAWAAFSESEEALNGAITNIALVLPPRMYEYSRIINLGFPYESGIREFDQGNGVTISLERDGFDFILHDSLKKETFCYSQYELDLILKLSYLKLM